MYNSTENDIIYTPSNIKFSDDHPDMSLVGTNIGNDTNGSRCFTNTKYDVVSRYVKVNFDSSLIKLTIASASSTDKRLADIGWLTDNNEYNLPIGASWFYMYFAPASGTSFTDEQKLAITNATVTSIIVEEPLYQPRQDNTLNTEDKTIVGAINEIKEAIKSIDALTLNGYKIWVGTTSELNQIVERDPNTLYFEIDDGTGEGEVVEDTIANGVLNLTADKYQKVINMVDGTSIVFPEVTKFTEIHLYFDANENMNLNFPDCKWRVEPNIEAGKSYEVICTYNTINWLVNMMVYS